MAIYDAPESLHVGTGVETVFGFNWPYLLPRDLLVTLNGTPVPTVLASSNQVVVTPAPAAGTIVRIFRNTPAQNPTYLFASGIPMLPRYIDGNNKQLLYALQEGLLEFQYARDRADDAYDIASIARAEAARALATSELAVTTVNAGLSRTLRARMSDPPIPELPPYMARAGKVLGFDAQGNPVGTVPQSGSGTELALDLANFQTEGLGAGMVGFRSRLATALPKTLDSFLRARPVSIMDFIPTNEHAALYDGTSTLDCTDYFHAAFAALSTGGELELGPCTYHTRGLILEHARNLRIRGQGWRSEIRNNSTTGAHGLWVRGTDVTDRVYGLALMSLTLRGNPASGDGIRLDRLGWYDVSGLEASVTNLTQIQILDSGGNGVQVGRSSTEGAGNSVKITGSLIRNSGRSGVVVIGQTNMVSVDGCAITLSKRDGVELNQVASTNTVSETILMDNTRYGVYTFRCEQPMIMNTAFNRNMGGAVAFAGDPVGAASVKYTEAGLIVGCLFGDNGRGSTTHREVSLYAVRGINIFGNYFYGTKQKTMVYLSDNCEGVMIAGNHFKDLTTEVKLELKPNAVGLSYTFDDDLDISRMRNILTTKTSQYVMPSGTTVFQFRKTLSDSAPFFLLDVDGSMRWSSGSAASDVALRRVVPGMLTCTGGIQADTLMIADAIPVPNAAGGMGRIFIDSADGKVKIRRANGTIHTFVME